MSSSLLVFLAASAVGLVLFGIGLISIALGAWTYVRSRRRAAPPALPPRSDRWESTTEKHLSPISTALRSIPEPPEVLPPGGRRAGPTLSPATLPALDEPTDDAAATELFQRGQMPPQFDAQTDATEVFSAHHAADDPALLVHTFDEEPPTLPGRLVAKKEP